MEIYLRRMLDDQDRRSEYTGMEFANPLDLAAIARGMGVAGEKVEDPAALGPALRKAYASGKPAVIDVSIDGAL
jgi:thiamine pyrophosphate-dependent acetolactate synthase large subunit-like protein